MLIPEALEFYLGLNNDLQDMFGQLGAMGGADGDFSDDDGGDGDSDDDVKPKKKSKK